VRGGLLLGAASCLPSLAGPAPAFASEAAGSASASAPRPSAPLPAELFPSAAQRSGELVAALPARLLTPDPANPHPLSATPVPRHVFDPLVDVPNDSRFIPALAESWEATDNYTWRFNLRRDVTFHDGRPFNADSVVYTLKRVRNNTELIKAFVYQDLDAVEKD